MKPWTFICIVLLAATPPLQAEPSSHFSTIPATAFTWRLSRSDGNRLLSFPADRVQTGGSPANTSLLADPVSLSTMILGSLQSHGTYLTASLTPAGPLTIVGDADAVPVLTASMTPGSSLSIDTNFMAYSHRADDLDVVGYVPDYSFVLDSMAAGDARGLPAYIRFSGNVAGDPDLVAALREINGPEQASGTTFRGRFTIVPVPGALLLVGLGTLAAGYLRWRVMS